MLADLKDTCNGCGGTLILFNLDWQDYSSGLIDAKVSGGYHSNYLSDMTDYRFSLCEKCLSEIFAKFKIPPYFGDYAFGLDTETDSKTFKEHLNHLKYRRWKNASYHYVNGEMVLNTASDVYKHFFKNKCTFRYKCKNKAKYLIGNHLEFINGININSVCDKHSLDPDIIINGSGKLFPYLTEAQQLKEAVFK